MNSAQSITSIFNNTLSWSNIRTKQDTCPTKLHLSRDLFSSLIKLAESIRTMVNDQTGFLLSKNRNKDIKCYRSILQRVGWVNDAVLNVCTANSELIAKLKKVKSTNVLLRYRNSLMSLKYQQRLKEQLDDLNNDIVDAFSSLGHSLQSQPFSLSSDYNPKRIPSFISIKVFLHRELSHKTHTLVQLAENLALRFLGMIRDSINRPGYDDLSGLVNEIYTESMELANVAQNFLVDLEQLLSKGCKAFMASKPEIGCNISWTRGHGY